MDSNFGTVARPADEVAILMGVFQLAVVVEEESCRWLNWSEKLWIGVVGARMKLDSILRGPRRTPFVAQ